MSAATPRPKSSPAAIEYNCIDTGPAPANHVLWSLQLVKPAVSFYWRFRPARFMSRAGPGDKSFEKLGLEGISR